MGGAKTGVAGGIAPAADGETFTGKTLEFIGVSVEGWEKVVFGASFEAFALVEGPVWGGAFWEACWIHCCQDVRRLGN